MVPSINYLAVLAALVASMVISFVYYHPAVLGRVWMGRRRLPGPRVLRWPPSGI